LVYLSYHTTHTTKAERRAEKQRQRRSAGSGHKTKRGIEGEDPAAAGIERFFSLKGPQKRITSERYSSFICCQGKAGTQTPFFSLDSWRKYASGEGPSPIQNLVSGSSGVSRLYQSLALDSATGTGAFANVIDLSPSVNHH